MVSWRASVVIFGSILFGYFLLLLMRAEVEISASSNAHAAAKELSLGSTSKRQALSVARTAREKAENTKQGARSPQTSFEQRAFCKLKMAKTGIPLDGELKVVAFPWDSGDQGFVAFIKSSSCPENGFSRVIVDALGKVESILDCNTLSISEIRFKTGTQSKVDDKSSGKDEANFAISGDGFFVIYCPSGLFLQRSGEFQVRAGKLWRGNCEVLNQFGTQFTWDGAALDEKGCTARGACLALASPNPNFSEIVDRTTIKIEGSSPDLLESGRIFRNAVEDFSDPQLGPLGPQWEDLPFFRPSETCPE